MQLAARVAQIMAGADYPPARKMSVGARVRALADFDLPEDFARHFRD